MSMGCRGKLRGCSGSVARVGEVSVILAVAIQQAKIYCICWRL